MNLLNLFDYEKAAAEKMQAPYYAYYAGGVADNIALRNNRSAFERIQLRPRMLVDTSTLSLKTVVGDRELAMPVMIAPTAMHKLAHPDGELATARAAKNAGIIQILSTFSSVSIEEVAAAGYATWFQLYIPNDRAEITKLVRRAEAAGCEALVLTVDVPAPGLRENLTRAGFAVPYDMPRPHIAQDEAFDDSNGWGVAAGRFLDRSLTWEDFGWLCEIANVPVWIKGVLRGDDALKAVKHGAAGIIVSNHGGRQLDTTIAPLDALPEIVAAVGDQVDMLMDGGVRRGVDVIKALALGAKAVLLGRAPLWGLAVNGEEGATDVLALLRAEIENAMVLCGCPSVNDIDQSLLHIP